MAVDRDIEAVLKRNSKWCNTVYNSYKSFVELDKIDEFYVHWFKMHLQENFQ